MVCKGDWLARGAIFESQLIRGLVFHQLALILSALFMCLSVAISLWLLFDHALHYLRPYEQKQSVSPRLSLDLELTSQHHPHPRHGPHLLNHFLL
jgi:hypothetical protein